MHNLSFKSISNVFSSFFPFLHRTGGHPSFSYILTKKQLDISDMSVKQISDQYFLYYTDDMAIGYSSATLHNMATYVCLFGLTIDISEETMNNQHISQILLTKLCQSEGSFYERVSMLAGRFILLYRYKGITKIMSDACGMLKIVYDKKSQAISSNIYLLDNYIRKHKREYRELFITKGFRYGSLGNLQPLQGIKILTPNHELHLNDFSVQRFYPRSKIESCSNIADIAAKIINYIQIQERILKQHYRLFYSLTAGLDSRFTLSSINAKTIKENDYVTYATQDAHVIDAIVARNISQKLSLHLTLLASSKYKDYVGKQGTIFDAKNDHLLKKCAEWAYYSHNRKNIPYYHSMVQQLKNDKPVLFIRSNIYEIGRAYWKQECHDHNSLLELSGYIRKFNYSEEEIKIFLKFFEESDLTDAGIKGNNLLDFFIGNIEWAHGFQKFYKRRIVYLILIVMLIVGKFWNCFLAFLLNNEKKQKSFTKLLIKMNCLKIFQLIPQK